MAEAELTHEVDVSDYVGAKRNAIASHRSQVTDTGFFLTMPEEMFADGVRHGSGSSSAVASRGCAPAGCSTNDPRRTSSATGGPRPVGTAIRIPTSTTSGAPRRRRPPTGWSRSPRPSRSPSSPARCDAAAERRRPCANGGGSPLGSTPRSPRSRRPQASRWSSGSSGCAPRRCGTWSELGEPYTTFRDGVVARIRALDDDTVVFSHFVAINAVIGACVGDDRLVIRHLDNCSITVVDVEPAGRLALVEGGHEADTLIR